MSQNITLLGASYSAVPAVTLPKTGGGTATFTDVTDTTAAASDVATGKYFYTSSGARTQGTNSGGGGGMNVQACIGKDTLAVNTYTATSLTLKVAKTGTYTVSWDGCRSSTSGTNGSRLYINSTAQTAYTSFDSTNTRLQHVEMTGVSLNANDTITVYCRARSASYYMSVCNLIIQQTA